MTVFEPEKKVEGAEFTPRSLVFSDAWGEVWHADHERHGAVLVVAYTTAQGKALAQEAAPGLERWKSVAESPVHGLLRILEMHLEASPPMLIVEDSGGKTLREACKTGKMDLARQARWAQAVTKTLMDIQGFPILPLHLTPDTIFHDSSGCPAAWRCLPIAPGVVQHRSLIAGGRYAPEELAAGKRRPDEVHADVYSFSWLWVEMIAGEFDLEHNAKKIREYVPYDKLSHILENGAVPTEGAFTGPMMTQMGVERWVKHDLEEDVSGHRKAVAAAERAPALQWFVEHRYLMKNLGIVFGTIVLCLFLYFVVIPWLFIPKDTVETPRGLVNLWTAEILERDAAGAREYIDGPGTIMSDRLVELIAEIEAENRAGALSHSSQQVGSGTSGRVAKVTFFSETNQPMAYAEINIFEENGERWYVRDVYIKDMTVPEEERRPLQYNEGLGEPEGWVDMPSDLPGSDQTDQTDQGDQTDQTDQPSGSVPRNVSPPPQGQETRWQPPPSP